MKLSILQIWNIEHLAVVVLVDGASLYVLSLQVNVKRVVEGLGAYDSYLVVLITVLQNNHQIL